MDDNLLVNTTCPYCKKTNLFAVSGFASSFSVRGAKVCRFCGKPLQVIIYAESLPEDFIVDDGTILGMKEKIKTCKRLRTENAYVLSMKLKEAQRFLAEADAMAERMAKERVQRKDTN